jgi:hypothetical protein
MTIYRTTKETKVREGTEEFLIPPDIYLKRVDFMQNLVLNGDYEGLTLELLDEYEYLGEMNLSTGEVYFFASIYGWNASFEWFPIGVEGLPHPSKNHRDKLYSLKNGETLDSFPKLAPRATQLQWLEERKARWYPQQECKPVRYVDINKLKNCQTLDEFCSLLRLEVSELIYKGYTTDPGEGYRKQGFYLGMSEVEAGALGKRYYYGFNWGVVENALSTPKEEHQEWKSPDVWVREGRNKFLKSFTFSINKNMDTGKVSISIT